MSHLFNLYKETSCYNVIWFHLSYGPDNFMTSTLLINLG